jgi:hypothetical protein
MENLNLTIDEWSCVRGALHYEIDRCQMYAEAAIKQGDVGEKSGHEFWTQRMRDTERALRKLEKRSRDIWTPDVED